MAQLVKNPSAVQETQVQSLGGEDHLEKEMATHSKEMATHSCLGNPMDRGAWWAIQSTGLQRVGQDLSN